MTAILRDSTAVVVVVVRTRPRAIPLAMKTMRKSLHGLPPGLPLVSYVGMGLRLAALREPFGPPELDPELRYYTLGVMVE